MPKDTFLNLPEVKRTHITKGLQEAFLSKPIAKISVSDIIRHTKIPRGSFYQYFTDLHDVFHYLIDDSLQSYERDFLARIGDEYAGFFTYMRNSFLIDLKYFKEFPHHRILSKFFRENHTFSGDFDDYKKRKHTFHVMCMDRLNLSDISSLSKERQLSAFRFLTQTKMLLIRHVLQKHISESEAFEEFCWMIDIFKRGLKEN